VFCVFWSWFAGLAFCCWFHWFHLIFVDEVGRIDLSSLTRGQEPKPLACLRYILTFDTLPACDFRGMWALPVMSLGFPLPVWCESC
jgi:hypothetical protein